MKHLFSTLIMVIMFTVYAMAEDVVVQTKDGKKYNGELKGRTDSTLTIYNRYSLMKFIFYAEEIVEATTAQGGRFTVENGKIVGHSYEEILARMKAEEKERMGDPNYAIGKAMKIAGGVSLGVGVPALAIGTILVAVGQSDINKVRQQISNTTVDVNADWAAYFKKGNQWQVKLLSDQNMVTAGLVLMPMGGALTIVGIPLYVRGKSIMSLSLQLSENGAGLALNF